MAKSSMTVENGLDLVLLLLKCQEDQLGAGARIEGTTKLQKLLFLLWKEGHFNDLVSDLYNFKAYDFGPCLDDIYDDIEFAESVDLIRTDLVPLGDRLSEGDSEAFLRDFQKRASRGIRRKDYELLAAGREAANDLWASLDSHHQVALKLVVKTFGTMNIRDVLRYVYSKYPKFAEKSQIAGSL